MRVAILTAFRSMPETYSLVNDVRDHIKLLKKYGHDVVFYAQEGCSGKGIECEMRDIFPRFSIEKGKVDPKKKKELIEIFKKELPQYDIVIEHDLIYLSHYFTYGEAIMECGVDVKWMHWAHSFIVGRNIDMPRSRYIYMNYTDVPRLAKSIGVPEEKIRVIFNDKDARIFFDWHPITKQIADKIDLFNRDIIQTYPLCTTRMDAKGIDKAIKVFAELKKLGQSVLLIFCNSNGRKPKHQEQVERKIEYAKSQGLEEDDIFFTSQLSRETRSGVPRDVVRDLMQISNLFVFPSTSEVCSNVLLEASMTKQLIILNKSFKPLFDFGDEGKTVMAYEFGSTRGINLMANMQSAHEKLAKEIIVQIEQSKPLQQFKKIHRICNIDTLYKEQWEPILEEDY